MPTAGDEKRLVGQAQKGDREAFLRLIQPYHERVYATAVRLLGNTEDALEVTQEAILRTFWKIQLFRGRSHFYTWLYRTALNLCYRRLTDTHAKIEARAVPIDHPPEREEGGLQEVAVPAQGLSPKEDTVRREEIQMVRQALAGLSKNDFQILILREFEELSYEQIAERLKLSKGTVMSRLHRARGALAERLKQLGIE